MPWDEAMEEIRSRHRATVRTMQGRGAPKAAEKDVWTHGKRLAGADVLIKIPLPGV
jgi:hypothetical protein